MLLQCVHKMAKILIAGQRGRRMTRIQQQNCFLYAQFSILLASFLRTKLLKLSLHVIGIYAGWQGRYSRVNKLLKSTSMHPLFMNNRHTRIYSCKRIYTHLIIQIYAKWIYIYIVRNLMIKKSILNNKYFPSLKIHFIHQQILVIF